MAFNPEQPLSLNALRDRHKVSCALMRGGLCDCAHTREKHNDGVQGMSERIEGVIVSCHPSLGKYGGGFGQIMGDNGRDYVWASGNVYRNFSHAKVGARVSFVVVAYSYASDIDQIDKSRCTK